MCTNVTLFRRGNIVTLKQRLLGLIATHEGRTVNGRWDPHMPSTHINCLEQLAFHFALEHFLPRLRGHHVLVRTDNSTIMAHFNRQGGLRSPRLHILAQ